MELSLFLAKFFGIYMLVVTVILIFFKEQMTSVVKEIFASNGQLAITGVINLMLGTAIVVSHSVWELNWRVIITLFGYLGMLKGFLRLAIPSVPRKYAESILQRGSSYWILLLFIASLGVYLTYVGFGL